MKNGTRLIALLLAALLLCSLTACDLTPPDLSGLISLDGSKVHDPNFKPQEIPEFMATGFGTAYSEQLSENERAVFDAVANALPGQNFFTVTLPLRLEVCKGAAPDEKMQNEALDRISTWILNALSVVRLELPEKFWLDTGYYSFSSAFEADAKGIYAVSTLELTVRLRSESHLTTGLTKHADSSPAVERQWLDMQAMLDGLRFEGDTTVGTIANINDYICARTTYDLNAPNRDSIVGVLLDGRAVCEGYAQTFLFLCKRAGISCANIIGQGVTEEGREGHMWSAVLVDGYWYATDVTWNDTTRSNSFFLTGLYTTYGGMTFLASHIAENRLGESKEFVLPPCSEQPYDSFQ